MPTTACVEALSGTSVTRVTETGLAAEWDHQPMVVVHLVIGVLALVVGLFSLIKRETIFARHQRRARHGLGPSQSPAAYAVIGVILTLVGVTQLLQALV